jgi:hypothetical protein
MFWSFVALYRVNMANWRKQPKKKKDDQLSSLLSAQTATVSDIIGILHPGIITKHHFFG